jgi:hypothetical protein
MPRAGASASRRCCRPEFLSQTELLELCMLAGHYEMLAGTIASAGIQPERPLQP